VQKKKSPKAAACLGALLFGGLTVSAFVFQFWPELSFALLVLLDP
jgi:hypothetical protein